MIDDFTLMLANSDPPLVDEPISLFTVLKLINEHKLTDDKISEASVEAIREALGYRDWKIEDKYTNPPTNWY